MGATVFLLVKSSLCDKLCNIGNCKLTNFARAKRLQNVHEHKDFYVV